MVSAIEVEPVRDWRSVIVTGSILPPGVVPAETIAPNEKLPPPSSLNNCVLEPPIELRSARTANPVLVGFVPGVTVTVSVVDAPGRTLFGLADPVPEGFVERGETVREIDAEPVR